MRMRYSPTNPFRPGTPIDESITIMNPAAKIGATAWRPFSSAMLAGVAALVDPPDEEEQRAGRQAVVDHLQHAAGDRLAGDGEDAEHDEAEVGDRRVGDEALEVLLHRGDDRAVDHADHGQRQEQRRAQWAASGNRYSPKRSRP